MSSFLAFIQNAVCGGKLTECQPDSPCPLRNMMVAVSCSGQYYYYILLYNEQYTED